MRKIQTAVIGAGFIGPAHVEAVRRLGLAEVVVLAEIDAAVAAAKAAQLGLARHTSNIDEVLADPAIDVVHVCVPNNLHYPIAKKALEAGKHVVCEKPLAMTSAEAEDLVRIAREKMRLGAIHFNNRGYPLAQHARALVQSGEIGEITIVTGNYMQDWLFYATDYNWRLEPEQSGATRAVGDIGSHWLDLAEFVSGCSVAEVCADFATFLPIRRKPLRAVEAYAGKILTSQDYQPVPVNTEDYAAVLLRFTGRARGSFTVSQVSAGRKNCLRLEIYGTKKALAWNSENPNELWIGRRDGNNETVIKDPSLLGSGVRHFADLPGGHAEGFDTSIKQTIRRMYTYISQDGLQQGLPVDFPTFADGLRELRLCDAIVQSAQERRWVGVESDAALHTAR
jgi:predicted dehydrogenase